MKTRTGFVSNSSSSSFVVGFKEVPTSDWELCDILFPLFKNGTGRSGVSGWDGRTEVVDARSASTIIFRDLDGQKPLTEEQILEEINAGYFEEYPPLEYSSDRESDKIRREYKEASGKDIHDKDADPKICKLYWSAQNRHYAAESAKIEAAAKKYWERIKPKFEGLKCFRFSFSDNDGGVFAALEHGNTFRNVEHIRISHH